jgi:hypothetical protein
MPTRPRRPQLSRNSRKPAVPWCVEKVVIGLTVRTRPLGQLFRQSRQSAVDIAQLLPRPPSDVAPVGRPVRRQVLTRQRHERAVGIVDQVRARLPQDVGCNPVDRRRLPLPAGRVERASDECTVDVRERPADPSRACPLGGPVAVMVPEPRHQVRTQLVRGSPDAGRERLDPSLDVRRSALLQAEVAPPAVVHDAAGDRVEQWMVLSDTGVHRAAQVGSAHQCVTGVRRADRVVRRAGQPGRHGDEGRPGHLRLDRPDAPDELHHGRFPAATDAWELATQGRCRECLPGVGALPGRSSTHSCGMTRLATSSRWSRSARSRIWR